MSPIKKRPSPVNTTITSSFFKHANAWLTPILMTPIRLAASRLTPTTATTPTVSVWGNFRKGVSSSKETDNTSNNNGDQSFTAASEFSDQSWAMLLISPMNAPRSSRSSQQPEDRGFTKIEPKIENDIIPTNIANNPSDGSYLNTAELPPGNIDYLVPDLTLTSLPSASSGLLLQPVDYFLQYNTPSSNLHVHQDYSSNIKQDDESEIIVEREVIEIIDENQSTSRPISSRRRHQVLPEITSTDEEHFTNCGEYKYLLELMAEHGNEHLQEECTQKKKGLYNCSHCTERFSTIKAFVQHLHKYKVQRPFKCSYVECPWFFVGFSNRPESRRHMKYQHEQAAAIPCPHPTCDRRFSRRDSMKRHYSRIHENYVPRAHRKQRTI